MRRRRALSALALLGVVGTAGCELSEVSVAEPEPFAVVEAYLFAFTPDQHVAIHAGGSADSAYVADAIVTLTGPDGAVTRFARAAAPDCFDASYGPGDRPFACYATVPDPAAVVPTPGSTYRLDVTLSNGESLTGETTVPADFRLVLPDADTLAVCRLPADTSLTVLWTRAPGTPAYILDLQLLNLDEVLADRGVDVPAAPLTLRGLSIGSEDTTIVLPDEFGVFDRFNLDAAILFALRGGLPAGLHARIGVAAADRNYVNWVRGGDFNPSGTVRVPSLRGDGTGVVASLTTRQLGITTDSTQKDVPECGSEG